MWSLGKDCAECVSALLTWSRYTREGVFVVSACDIKQKTNLSLKTRNMRNNFNLKSKYKSATIYSQVKPNCLLLTVCPSGGSLWEIIYQKKYIRKFSKPTSAFNAVAFNAVVVQNP